jgi:small subunit ribosomal protein S20
MAHSKSALKRWRQNEKRRARNKPVRTAARTSVKNARSVITSGEGDAQAAIAEAMSIVDRAAKRNVIHKNAAARHKSRLMKLQNKVGAGVTTEEPKKKARKTTARKTAAKKSTSRAKKS